MKTLFVVFISLGYILPSLLTAREGLIDIDYPDAEYAKFKINLGRPMLFLTGKIIGDEEREVSEFLSSLRSVRIRIYDQVALRGERFEEVLKFYHRQLQDSEWDVLIRVKEEDSTVAIYSLTRKDVVCGLVVFVGKPEEVVVVNLAGKIDIAELSQIDDIAGVNLDLPEINSEK